MLAMNMLIANHRVLAKVIARRSLTNVFQISPVLAIVMVTQVVRWGEGLVDAINSCGSYFKVVLMSLMVFQGRWCRLKVNRNVKEEDRSWWKPSNPPMSALKRIGSQISAEPRCQTQQDSNWMDQLSVLLFSVRVLGTNFDKHRQYPRICMSESCCSSYCSCIIYNDIIVDGS